MIELNLCCDQILGPDGFRDGVLHLRDGRIEQNGDGKVVNLGGYLVLPGIIDVHGDGFERHLAPRRGAMKQMNEGVRAAESELAANGITTGVLAQFVSWEGGLRGLEFAEQVLMPFPRPRPTW